MGEGTKIAWADDTFNPWEGCVEVSPACDNCYARTVNARFHAGAENWGKDAPRRFHSEQYWNKPLRWNKDAALTGKQRLVFCASMADVFESGRPDLEPWRLRLWALILKTPALTWLLLTKRPQNIERMIPEELTRAHNIWYGTTIESPDYLWRADALIEHARHAPVRFVSMEPLLAETSIEDHLDPCAAPCGETSATINWVITGCESGTGARHTPTDHYRKLRDECAKYGVDFHFKQAPLGADGITEGPGSFRKPDRRKGADGMTRVHWLVEKPYLDGFQHIARPPA